MKQYKPDKIIIEYGLEHSTITQNVLLRSPEVPIEYIDSTDELLRQFRQLRPTITQAKKNLVLTRHRGRFFKSCPAGQTKGHFENACCNYFVLNYASNCHMECTYCYLQSYLNFPHMVIYANCDDLLSELQQVLSRKSRPFYRIGTGELADSLALDPLTSYSVPLVQFFARQEKAVLEFKTKSNCVANILDLDHRGHTVVSWSMNPRFVQKKEEHKTATIEERFQAAELCVRAGYPVAFHLDPLVFYPHWEKDYQLLIEEIFERIPATSIPWISMGSLRMNPPLKDLIRQRFPQSFLPLGELIPCQDGKLRYFKPIRVMMFRRVLGWIRSKTTTTSVFTCMEEPQTWTKIFGHAPPSEKHLNDKLIESLINLV